MLVSQRAQLFFKGRQQNSLHDPLELIQETGSGKLHTVRMTSFGLGRDNPILMLEVTGDKLLCPLKFARGSDY